MNELVTLLEKVENPGTFSVSGTLPAIPPGLTVQGLGTVALPILTQQAEALIALSEQAPFGRGEATIVDRSVRNVWQISAQNFALTNPQWAAALQKSIEQIGKTLGLYDSEITIEPYKLLIYGKGSFFTTHRDTEKIPNMFATLVINLPSAHEGGELIISHGGQSQRYSFADADLFNPTFVAFYADCYHEVKPITDGYRICLIYNLAIAKRKEQPRLVQQFKLIEEIGHAIQTWVAEKRESPILAYLLEHEYSEKNLALTNLKNGDFAKASVLFSAAAKNDCHAYLCLVTYYRTSYGETTVYDRYGYGEDLDEDDFEEYDVDREEVYAHAFMTAEGDKVAITKLQLDEEELFAKTALHDGPGYGFSISEATGNEGATKDLWYHRGAVIIWPKARAFDLIPKMDIAYRIRFLQEAVQENKPLEGEQLQQIIRLAHHVIQQQPVYSTEDLSQTLMVIGDMDLLRTYLQKQLNVYDLNRVNAAGFIAITERFGWQPFAETVRPYLTPQRGALPWLAALLRVKEPLSSEGQSILSSWVSALWKPALAQHPTVETIADLLWTVAVLKIDAIVDEVIALLAQQQKHEFLTAIYGPAVERSIKALAGHDYDRAILQQFVENARQRLQTAFPTPPAQPTDWSRAGQLGCHCEFCTQVNQLLPDPGRREISFYQTLKRNLIHVEGEIQKSGVDLDITIRKRAPKFDGTCRKNQKSYDQQRALFDSAQKIMQALQITSGPR